MIRIVQIGTIHSCRKATRQRVNQTSRPTEDVLGLYLAYGGVRFFRQLIHCVEESRTLANK
jgi:hypothetical protein